MATSLLTHEDTGYEGLTSHGGRSMVLKLMILAIALWGSTIQAQDLGSSPDLYPERLRMDIETLRSAIHEAHPDPYRYRTRIELDALIDSVSAGVDRPMSIVGFHGELTRILNAVGDSHCRLDWPRDYADHLRSETALIPIQVRVLPDGLYVEGELKGFRSIPIGSRVLSVNGIDADEIVERLMATVVTDGANRTYAERVVEREFPWRYNSFIERGASYRVRYITPEKEEEERTVFALTGTEIGHARKPAGASLLPWGARWVPEIATLWVTLKTLDPDSLVNAGQRADRFLSAMLDEAKKNKAKTMVIDVRGAGGRDLAMAEMVFAAVAKAPFRVLDDMMVRSITAPEQRSSHLVPVDFYASTTANFHTSTGGAYRFPENDPRLGEYEPLPKAFQGKLYVICNGGTVDAAAALVMMAKRGGRGRIVGEETGSNAHAFTGGAEWLVTLPNSGLALHVPLLSYVPAGRASGPLDRGEQPHHRAYQQPGAMARGKDSIMDSLLEMIRELQ
ncbi:MAG: hypothetical protein KDC00_06440 [Flavobacteriales bacterium]|nr:hypothetical protein [Flavobacteriales bacterium]